MVVGFYFTDRIRMHPSGYRIYSKKELAELCKKSNYEKQLREWKETGHFNPDPLPHQEEGPIRYFNVDALKPNPYSEAQQYQRELAEHQLQAMNDLRMNDLRMNEELSNRQFIRDIGEDYDTLMDGVCNGILDLFK